MTDAEGNPLIQPGQAITVVGESGELAFTVATGFLDADFQSGRGNERGTAPDLYISEQALEKLSGEPKSFGLLLILLIAVMTKGLWSSFNPLLLRHRALRFCHDMKSSKKWPDIC